MLGMQEQFSQIFIDKDIELYCPDVVQTMSEEDLIQIVPEYDGWIIGDDPATREVFLAGKEGKLKAAVKWGIGVDNVDFAICKELGIPITNTPDMFGPEVADIAMNYISGLARETYFIDRAIRDGGWPKNCGISLGRKKVGLIGYGDIGKNTAKRFTAADMTGVVYDPAYDSSANTEQLEFLPWPSRIDECDFLVFTCSLNVDNRHMLNERILSQCKQGVRVINVARGPLIHEKSLVEAIQNGAVHSAALDVFEDEPLLTESPLREQSLCIFGSHNSSNTSDAVAKTNDRAISLLFQFLEVD